MKINSKNTAIVLLTLAGVLILGGIALLLFLVPGAATFFKVCLVIISILMIILKHVEKKMNYERKNSSQKPA